MEKERKTEKESERIQRNERTDEPTKGRQTNRKKINREREKQERKRVDTASFNDHLFIFASRWKGNYVEVYPSTTNFYHVLLSAKLFTLKEKKSVGKGFLVLLVCLIMVTNLRFEMEWKLRGNVPEQYQF